MTLWSITAVASCVLREQFAEHCRILNLDAIASKEILPARILLEVDMITLLDIAYTVEDVVSVHM